MKQTINGVDFYPKQSEDWATQYRSVGYLVRPPKGYDPSKVYAAELLVHGNGELWDGRVSDLVNLYDGVLVGGVRQWPFVTDECKQRWDDEGIIGIVPNYKSNLTPDNTNYILDEVQKAYSVDKTQIGMIGFSWGGRAVLDYVSRSVDNAKRLAMAVSCAGVNGVSNYSNIVSANLQLILTTANVDKKVPKESNSDVVYKRLMDLNPTIKPYYIVFPGEGHGTLNEIIGGISHPLIPQSVHKYLKSISTNNRKPYPTVETGIPTNPTTPTKPTEPEIPITVTAAFNIAEGDILTTSEFELDASASKGATSFYWQAERTEIPWGGPIFDNGTVGGPKKKMSNLTNGKWKAQLKVNGSVESKWVNFTVKIGNNPASKTLASVAPAPVDIIWSDKTTEKGTVEFKDSKWILKDATGKPV